MAKRPRVINNRRMRAIIGFFPVDLFPVGIYRSLVALLLLIGFLSSFSVTEVHGDSFTCVQELKDTSLLGRVQQMYQQTKSIEATFIQESYLAALDISERARGKVYFQQPGMMSWNYEIPNGQKFIVKDQVAHYFQPETNTLLIEHLPEILLSQLPVSFLLGAGELSKSFEVTRACKTIDGVLLQLKPLKGDSNLTGCDLLVNSDYRLNGVKILDTQGNTTTILLSEVRYNNALQEDLFRLTPPKGTDIDDRRKT